MSAHASVMRRSSPFTRSTFVALALLVVAFMVFASVFLPTSARADEAPPIDETASSDVVNLVVEPASEVPAPPSAPVEQPAPEPVSEPAPVEQPAAPSVPEESVVVDAPAVNTEETPDASTTDVEEASQATDTAAVPETTEAEVSPDAAPAAEDELVDRPVAESGVAASGKDLYVKALSGDFTDWEIVIRDADSNLVASRGNLSVGGEYTFRVFETGDYQIALVHPTLDSMGLGDFHVVIPTVPHGAAYVTVTGASASGSADAGATSGTGTVSFDYVVSDAVYDTTSVGIRIYPVGSDDPAVFVNLQLSGSGHVSESYELPLGDYTVRILGDHNYGVDVDGWGPLTADLSLSIEAEEVPGITPEKPTVDGNTVTIPTQDGVEYFDTKTGETVTGEVEIPVDDICIGARTYVWGSDGYVTWIETVVLKTWCFEYLPQNDWLKSSSFTYDCEAGVVVHHFTKTPVTYTRDEDDKVVMTLGEPVVKDTSYPMTDEELAACEPVVPVDPTDPTDPVDPVNPVDNGNGGVTPGNPNTGQTGGGTKGTATVKSNTNDSLAVTGGEIEGNLALAGLAASLLLGGAALLRRRRGNVTN